MNSEKKTSKIDLFIKEYSKKDIKLNKGTELNKIKQLEKKINFEFPEDFKEFYLKINGFDWEVDENMYCLWSIERIEEEISEYYPKGNVIIDFIPICDYLFHSHQVGFMTTKKGLFKDYIPNEEKICEGFNDFLDLLLQNENILY